MEGGGVHLRGEVGELWRYGCKAGLVFRWRLDGWEREWELQAERYKLDPLLFTNGRREIDVVLSLPASTELKAKDGHIWTATIADGRTHPAIVIKGRSGLRAQKGRAR